MSSHDTLTLNGDSLAIEVQSGRRFNLGKAGFCWAIGTLVGAVIGAATAHGGASEFRGQTESLWGAAIGGTLGIAFGSWPSRTWQPVGNVRTGGSFGREEQRYGSFATDRRYFAAVQETPLVGSGARYVSYLTAADLRNRQGSSFSAPVIGDR
jgi:hypothetical protein